MKESRKITTWNRLDLGTLGFLTDFAQNPPQTHMHHEFGDLPKSMQDKIGQGEWDSSRIVWAMR